MTARPWLLAAAAVAAAAAPARAQDTLAWRFDEPVYLEVVQQADTTTKMLGKTDTKVMNTRFVLRLAPGKATAAGQTLEGTVTSVQYKMTDGKADDPILNLKGGRFKIGLGAGNKKLKATGGADLVDSTFGDLADRATPAERRFLTNILDALLQSQVEEAYPPLPDAPVAAGDTWKHATRMEVASLMSMRLEKTYKAVGRVVLDGKPLVAIGVTAKMTLAPPDGETTALPFKVIDVRETGRPRYEGTVYFDPAAGRPHRVDITMQANMEVTVAANGLEATGNATERRTMTFRFHPTNPDARRLD